MRHAGEIGNREASVNVLTHPKRKLRFRSDKLLRFDVLAQPDNFALALRHLDTDRTLSGHALDQNALGTQGETQVVGESGDAAVFDARFGLELESCNHWT